MEPCNLKCSYRKFDYFLLQINSINDLQHLETKLLNLKKLDGSNKYVVLAFHDNLKSEAIHKIILDTVALANKHDLILHSIIRNDNIIVDSFDGVPVVELPENGNTVKSLDNINKTMIYDEPVRSGIQIKNEGDIIITTFVSNNAEVISTANIHVYGEARGRLIAGSAGDKRARIFVNKFNPELISIGGVFRTMESKLPDSILNKAVMVSLDDKNHLNVTQIS